ncbi:MAG: hypothetical protein HC904_13710 [Blastochloris sp.]|nr:hypothetical protein [Blastochloris sp.]
MPQQDKSHSSIGCSQLEGREIIPATQEELKEAIRLAFDYRGDTTLRFKDGGSMEGYVFNFDHKNRQISLFVKEGVKESVTKTASYDQVASIFFSGADIAFGKSWDDWQTKSAKLKAEEAARHDAQAQELGIL